MPAGHAPLQKRGATRPQPPLRNGALRLPSSPVRLRDYPAAGSGAIRSPSFGRNSTPRSDSLPWRSMWVEHRTVPAAATSERSTTRCRPPRLSATAVGTPDNRDNVRRALKLAAGRAGVPAFADLTTHDFRRICASLLVASGVKKPVAMAILGHKNAAMLDEVYASAVTEELMQAARQLQEYVAGEA